MNLIQPAKAKTTPLRWAHRSAVLSPQSPSTPARARTTSCHSTPGIPRRHSCQHRSCSPIGHLPLLLSERAFSHGTTLSRVPTHYRPMRALPRHAQPLATTVTLHQRSCRQEESKQASPDWLGHQPNTTLPHSLSRASPAAQACHWPLAAVPHIMLVRQHLTTPIVAQRCISI
jgi:hypothetical protein